MDDTEALVRRAAAGDDAAFGLLYERFCTPLYRYLLARLGDHAEAEDMTAEVFVQAAERMRSFRGDAAGFRGWLFTIARHDLYDRARRARRYQVRPVAEPPEPADAVAGSSGDGDPAELALARLDALTVLAAMEQLTEAQREVIALRFAAGLSSQEVAATLGKPLTAVKSLQHRGLAALRRAMRNSGVGER